MALKGKDLAENTKNSFKNLLNSLQTELIKTGIEDNSFNQNPFERAEHSLQTEEEVEIIGNITE